MFRAMVALICAAFILLAPAQPHLFGNHALWLRPWMMYADAGVGVLNGNFSLHQPSGEVQELDVLEVLGLERYPNSPSFRYEHRVFGEADLVPFAEEYCATMADGERLSFAGRRGSRGGWVALESTDVCGGTL